MGQQLDVIARSRARGPPPQLAALRATLEPQVERVVDVVGRQPPGPDRLGLDLGAARVVRRAGGELVLERAARRVGDVMAEAGAVGHDRHQRPVAWRRRPQRIAGTDREPVHGAGAGGAEPFTMIGHREHVHVHALAAANLLDAQHLTAAHGQRKPRPGGDHVVSGRHRAPRRRPRDGRRSTP